jgi:uncharacterized protein YndB with AHSA1/START domain
MSERSADLDDANSRALDADAPRSLTLTRMFQASRERVWSALTHPDAMIRWHGPAFYPAVEVMADVRVGGTWRACLRSDKAEDVLLWQSGQYLVVAPPERLEFTFAWETPDHEDGPGVLTHISIRLEQLADGATRMHFSQTGFLSANSATSHSAGWSGTFDRLAEFLLNNGLRTASENRCVR